MLKELEQGEFKNFFKHFTPNLSKILQKELTGVIFTPATMIRLHTNILSNQTDK